MIFYMSNHTVSVFSAFRINVIIIIVFEATNVNNITSIFDININSVSALMPSL